MTKLFLRAALAVLLASCAAAGAYASPEGAEPAQSGLGGGPIEVSASCSAERITKGARVEP